MHKKTKKKISSMTAEELTKKLSRNILIIASSGIFAVLSFLFFAPVIGHVFAFIFGPRGTTITGPKYTLQPPRFQTLPDKTNNENINISGYSKAGTTIKLFVNGPEAGNTISGADGVFNFSDIKLNSGKNVLTAKSTDTNGEESEPSMTYTIYLDKDKPKIELTDLKDGDTIRNLDSRITIQGKIDEKATIKINGNSAIQKPDLTFSYILGVKEGEVELKIEVTDDAGNTETKELKVTYQKRSS